MNRRLIEFLVVAFLAFVALPLWAHRMSGTPRDFAILFAGVALTSCMAVRAVLR